MIRLDDFEPIGQFEIKSGSVRVTDPCYERGTWCAGTIDEVKNGVWEAFIKMDSYDGRVAELAVFHKDIPNKLVKDSNWLEQGIDVGVDSGQAGVFDDELYPEGETGEYGDEDSFYGKCCQLTIDKGSGTLSFGAVSRSGYGDGSYICYTIEDKDNIVGIKIVFVDEYDEDEDYDEYDDNEDN